MLFSLIPLWLNHLSTDRWIVNCSSTLIIDITKALYLLSKYIRNQNCAKGYSKTTLKLEMLKNAQISD